MLVVFCMLVPYAVTCSMLLCQQQLCIGFVIKQNCSCYPLVPVWHVVHLSLPQEAVLQCFKHGLHGARCCYNFSLLNG
jgi:hypothetical protein